MGAQTVTVGPRIVRAWFDTIVNPLIDALESEMRVLGNRNFTWRFRPAGFEFIRRIGRHLDSRMLANLDHLTAFYRDIDISFGNHDQSVDALRRDVEELHRCIVQAPEFQKLLEEAVSPDSLRELGVSSPTEIFGAYPKEDWAGVVAQYVVNGTGELPFHYSTAKLWNARRHELTGILKTPEIESRYNSVVGLAVELARIDADLLARLKDLRLELSVTHDQPFVTAESGLQPHWPVQQ